MVPAIELRHAAIHLDAEVTRLSDVLDVAAASIAEQCGRDAAAIRAAFDDVADTNFGIGAGIAVPHASISGLTARVVSLVRARKPLAIGAIDGAPVDLFFVVVYPGDDPVGHLELLAHLAALCRSRVLRDGLRTAPSEREVSTLIAAAESRLGGGLSHAPTAARRSLAIVSVAGERAADSIILGLIREHLGEATIVDAQTLQEAASREVPLFAGFRDLFGDPGGRRMIFAHIDAERAEALASVVERACGEQPSATAELIVLPISGRWQWAPEPEPERGGH